MTDRDSVARRDLERLSAFLDGELSASETERLEARLETDENLSRTLEALRATSAALGSLPEMRPPRSFALTEDMVRPRRAYPILQLSTAIAALSFVLVVGADLLLSSARGAAVEAPGQALFAAEQIAEDQAAEPEALETIVGEVEGEFAAAPAAEEGAADSELERSAAPAPAEDAVEDSERGIAGAAEPEAEAGEEAVDQEFQKQEAELDEEQIGEPVQEDAGDPLADDGALALEEQPPAALDELTFEQDAALDEAPAEPNLLRIIEIVLATILIALIGLTLWVRQRV